MDKGIFDSMDKGIFDSMDKEKISLKNRFSSAKHYTESKLNVCLTKRKSKL